MKTLELPLPRDTAIALLSRARGVPASELETVNDATLNEWLQDESVKELVRHLIGTFLQEPERPAHDQ